MSTKDKILIGSIVVLSLIICIGYGYIHYNNIEKQRIQDELLISNQNQQSLKDRLALTNDSLLSYSVYVDDIINTNKNSISMISTKVNLLGDSIKILNKLLASSTIIDDSDKIVIPFSGNKNKIHYDGNTVFYKKKKIGLYSIDITVDPTNFSSLIYFDKQDSLIKNELRADGVLINNPLTTVSPEIYLLMKKQIITCPPIHDDFLDRLKLYGNISTIYVNEYVMAYNIGMIYSTNRYDVGIYKNIFKKEYGVDINYKYSINEITNLIFK